MKCLILAGGFGTRLYPPTIHRIKGLLAFKGKPLLTHIVDKIPRDINILVSTNKKFEADFYRWQNTVDRPVELCVEEARTGRQKLGAVSSIDYWVKRKNVAEDLLVIAADNYFEFQMSEFIAAYNGKNTLVAIHDIGDKKLASQFGVVRLDGHKVVELDEKPAKLKSSLIATACYILPRRVFSNLSQYCSEGKRDNLGNFISYLIDTDEVHSYLFTEPWFDIGSRPEIASRVVTQ